MSHLDENKPGGRWVCTDCDPVATSDRPGFCENCGANLRPDGSIQSIHGRPDDVIRVHRELSAVAAKDRAQRRTPWASGSFYLVALVAAIFALLVVGRALPLWALPIVAMAAVLIVATIGALQLRQDERLSERNFLKLMLTVLARLPSLLQSKKSRTDEGPDA